MTLSNDTIGHEAPIALELKATVQTRQLLRDATESGSGKKREERGSREKRDG